VVEAHLPAAWIATTLGLPFANGAAQSGTPFVKHALVVLLVPFLAVTLGGAIHAICARCLAHDVHRRSPSPRAALLPGPS